MIRENIRKKWLKLTVIRASIKCLFPLFLVIIVSSGISGVSEANAKIVKALSALLAVGIFGFFFAGVGTYVFYRCAYKKPGTALLTFNLFCYLIYIPFALFSLVGYLKEIYAGVTLAKTFPEAFWMSIGLVVFFLCFLFIDLFEYYWVYYGFKLRKMNKELQGENILKEPEFHQVIVAMENTTSIDRLEAVYNAEIRKYPQISWYVTKRFREFRDQLKQKD